MRHTERAVHSEAVVSDDSVWVARVASLAVVGVTMAVVLRDRAAVVAFPHYVLASVLRALAIATAICLHLALFAAEGLLIYVLLSAELLHAVCCASKVRFFAVVALKECARVHG